MATKQTVWTGQFLSVGMTNLPEKQLFSSRPKIKSSPWNLLLYKRKQLHKKCRIWGVDKIQAITASSVCVNGNKRKSKQILLYPSILFQRDYHNEALLVLFSNILIVQNVNNKPVFYFFVD